MGEFKRRESRPGSRFSRPKRFSPDRSRDRDSDSRSRRGRNGDRETFEATCAKCGKQCDLPFKPRTSKPVYCRDCFKGGDFETSKPNQAGELDKINEKLDKIMRSLHID